MSLLIRYNNVPFVSIDNKRFAFVFLTKLVVALVVLVVLVILVENTHFECKLVTDREAWPAAVLGAAKSGT